MSLLQSLQKAVKAHHLIALLAVIAIGVLLYNYSQGKGSPRSGMAHGDSDASQVINTQFAKDPAAPAMPFGQNEGPSTVSGVQSGQQQMPSSCQRKDTAKPGDLLPKDSNSQFAQLNPMGSGDLQAVKLLKAGYHSGINTVGSSLRNANLQLRSEPPNPQTPVSPWSNSTIEPDLMRTPLELGCKC
jgi:hypothetical protein